MKTPAIDTKTTSAAQDVFKFVRNKAYQYLRPDGLNIEETAKAVKTPVPQFFADTTLINPAVKPANAGQHLDLYVNDSYIF